MLTLDHSRKTNLTNPSLFGTFNKTTHTGFNDIGSHDAESHDAESHDAGSHDAGSHDAQIV